MVGLEILSGITPYAAMRLNDSEWLEAMEKRRVLPQKEHYLSVRHGAWTPLRSCWKWNPSERPTIQKLKDYFDHHYAPDSTQRQKVVYIIVRADD